MSRWRHITRKVTATIEVGASPLGAAVDQATRLIYVTNTGSDTVSMIRAA